MLMSHRMNCLRLFKNLRPKPLLINSSPNTLLINSSPNTLLINSSPVKYASQHPLKFLEIQNWWKEKDDIPDRWQLIYKSSMGNLLNYTTTYLTFTTVTVACSCIYYAAFLFDKNTYNDPLVVGDGVVIANSALEGLIYLSAFVLFHIGVKMVLTKYVVRLYQDGDNYVAIFRGHWFNSIVKHQFHLKDFKKLSPSMLITWSDAIYSLGNKKGILFENYFKTPHHYNYLLYKKKISTDEDQPK